MMGRKATSRDGGVMDMSAIECLERYGDDVGSQKEVWITLLRTGLCAGPPPL